ncbi:uncharacterized protein LOC116029708 [Ipomoea triloba]|uniref:uncharacterized protein LOC116029708 n=1 Tax=Ipomoea triloba TaxID=35885 RepID=UPI00125CFF54|nr:uncharacterized protein LOC116029708 [Ipomoea triloba]
MIEHRGEEVIIWNCQGAASKQFLRAAKWLISKHHPDILCLVETRTSGYNADAVCTNLGFENWAEITSREWNFSVVYGSPSPHLRRRLWTALSRNTVQINHPWLIVGDFNAIVNNDECPKFTWRRGKEEGTFKGARLDRVLCSLDWLDLVTTSKVNHLTTFESDHNPLLVDLDTKETRHTNSFLFQGAWTNHHSFNQLVSNNWNGDLSVWQNKDAMAAKLKQWNRTVFGNIHHRKNRLLRRIEGIQKLFDHARHAGIINLERKIRLELEDTLQQEEIFWYQQAREDWIASGDRNTKFYHAATKSKKTKRSEPTFLDNDGNTMNDSHEIKIAIQSYFTNIFTKDAEADLCRVPHGNFPRLCENDWEIFNAEFTIEEVRAALYEMRPLKAPGPDGFHAMFYQKAWPVVGKSVFKQVDLFLKSGVMEEGNDRLKPILKKLVGQEQSSFVPGRQITDNILLYQEVMHSMRTKQGSKGFMVLKIDLEKSYDRLNWDFIRDTLKDVGMSNDWTILMPAGIWEEIDKRIRRFIWGGTPEVRKCHLVCWEEVTKPKRLGGLGIRAAKDMNMAFMAKLGWQVITNKESMWVKVLKEKYGHGKVSIDAISTKPVCSNAWRGIVAALHIVEKGIRSHVKNGRNTNFWTDVWLTKESLHHCVPDHALTKGIANRVYDYWQTDRGWKWERLTHLPLQTRQELLRVTIQDGEGDNEHYWSREASGEFSVTSAHDLCHDYPTDMQEKC